MRTHGKKYNTAAKGRDPALVYQPRQALEILKQSAFAKFDETVEVAVRLGVDPRHADQVVRGTVVLPAGSGKSVRAHRERGSVSVPCGRLVPSAPLSEIQ